MEISKETRSAIPTSNYLFFLLPRERQHGDDAFLNVEAGCA